MQSGFFYFTENKYYFHCNRRPRNAGEQRLFSAAPRFGGLCPFGRAFELLLRALLEHEVVEVGVATPAAAGSAFETDFSTVLEAGVHERNVVEPFELLRGDVGVVPAELAGVLLHHGDELVEPDSVELQRVAERILVVGHHGLGGAVDDPLERVPSWNDGEELLPLHPRVDVVDLAVGVLGNMNEHDHPPIGLLWIHRCEAVYFSEKISDE